MQGNQKTSSHAIRALLLLGAFSFTGASAFSKDFQLKGLKLGMTESEACGSAEITDLQKLADASSVPDVVMPASKCEVQADSIAGYQPDGPLRLAFWKGRLVRVVAKFEGMKFMAVLSIHDAIIQTYGKPNLTKKGPARTLTETWRIGTQRLEVESSNANGEYIGIFMSDSVGWEALRRAQMQMQAELAKQTNQRQLNDLVQ